MVKHQGCQLFEQKNILLMWLETVWAYEKVEKYCSKGVKLITISVNWACLLKKSNTIRKRLITQENIKYWEK